MPFLLGIQPAGLALYDMPVRVRAYVPPPVYHLLLAVLLLCIPRLPCKEVGLHPGPTVGRALPRFKFVQCILSKQCCLTQYCLGGVGASQG